MNLQENVPAEIRLLQNQGKAILLKIDKAGVTEVNVFLLLRLYYEKNFILWKKSLRCLFKNKKIGGRRTSFLFKGQNIAMEISRIEMGEIMVVV